MPVARARLGALEVSAQGYGAMSLTDAYGPVDDETALATLRRAVDAGATFIDTANVYGDGRSERTIARLLPGRRDQIQLASKFGIVAGGGIGKRGINGRPEYVRTQIDESLARLGTDHLDLYYQHRVDPTVPIEETVGAMAELVTAGKVLHLGLSEATGDEIRRAAAVHPIAAVQSEWNILSRDIEANVLPAVAEVGAGFVPYSPLSRGYIGRGFDRSMVGDGDARNSFPRFDPESLAANAPLRRRILAVADDAGVTPAQLALAWIQRTASESGVVSVAIPGTRRADRVDENLAALGLRLSDEHMNALDPIAGLVSGDRSRDPLWTSGGREAAAA